MLIISLKEYDVIFSSIRCIDWNGAYALYSIHKHSKLGTLQKNEKNIDIGNKKKKKTTCS